MHLGKQKYLFIKWSSKISPNVIDWFRSIYFSLLGSSMLTLSLKYSTLSICSLVIFAGGVLSFLFGLLVSVSIANRFKRHEKNYDGLSESSKSIKKPEEYYFEQEIDTNNKISRSAEHFFFYSLWIPALLCIGYAGFYMETKSSNNSLESKEMLHRVETKVQEMDSAMRIIIDDGMDKKLFRDSLNFTKNVICKQETQIDSLKKVINSLSQKPKDNTNKSTN